MLTSLPRIISKRSRIVDFMLLILRKEWSVSRSVKERQRLSGEEDPPSRGYSMTLETRSLRSMFRLHRKLSMLREKLSTRWSRKDPQSTKFLQLAMSIIRIPIISTICIVWSTNRWIDSGREILVPVLEIRLLLRGISLRVSVGWNDCGTLS